MSVREDVKILLVRENISLAQLAREMSVALKKEIKADNLSQKLRKSTMKYDEVKQIAEILGYKIKFEK